MTDLPPRPPLAAVVVRAGFGAAFCLAAVWAGAAHAQGQDSTTSPSGPQTSAHPPPLLSTQDVTTVPSGTPKPGTPLPARYRVRAAPGLALPGPIAPASPARLACADIGDPTARARCESRTTPPAPPKGAEP